MEKQQQAMKMMAKRMKEQELLKAQKQMKQNLSKSRATSQQPESQDSKNKQLMQSLHVNDISRRQVGQEQNKGQQQKKKFNMDSLIYKPKNDFADDKQLKQKEREEPMVLDAASTVQDQFTAPRDSLASQVADTVKLVEQKLLSAQNKLARGSLGVNAQVKGFNSTVVPLVKQQQSQHNADHLISTADHSDIKHTQKVLFGSTATQTAAKLACDTTPVDKTSQFTIMVCGEKTPSQFKEEVKGKDLFDDGPTTDEHGNRLSILPNKSRPKVPSTKKKSSLKSTVPKKQSVKGVQQTKTSTKKSMPKTDEDETESKPKTLLEKVTQENEKMKTTNGINKTGQQRTNFVKMNMKQNYKPRLRGAQFTNKMMAKKRNAMRFNERFQRKLKIEQMQNRDQVNAYGGLGKVGMDYEGGMKVREGEEDLVPGFSASALKFVRKIEESEEEDNLLENSEEIKHLEKIDEDVKEEDPSEEPIEGEYDKAAYKIPDSDEGYLKILKERFGHDSFKNGQLEAIKLLVEKNDNTLVVLATGGGKSLVYQFVSLFKTGLILVITPLISLMTDQLQKLPDFIPGASLNSQQPYSLKRQVIQAVQDKHIKVLFLSPEKLFIEDLSRYNRRIAMVCVDEIHCASEWSHNFRPAYLKLNDMVKEKVSHANKIYEEKRQKESKRKIQPEPDCVILGLTATATRATQISICNIFDIKHPENIITEANLARINLSLSITRDPEKMKGLLSLLQSASFKKLTSILIFATHKATCDRLASHLNQNGINSASYHAGKSDQQRQFIQKNFINNNTRVLVCTIAFSMGIDKSDIQSVIHYDMPKSIENYVQEIGRAGRDGKLARCHMFLNNEDFYQIRRLILGEVLDQENATRLTNKIIVESKKKVYQIMSGESLRTKRNPKKRKAKDISGEEEEEKDDKLMEDFENEFEISSLYEKADKTTKTILLADIPNIKNAHDPKLYLFLDVKQTTSSLDLKKEVILTMLNCLEKLPNSFFKLEGILPERVGVRFHSKTPEQMSEENPFIKEFLQHAKEHQGVWGASIPQLAYEMGISPFQIPRILFTLQDHGNGHISYETDNEAFVLRLLSFPTGQQTIAISRDLLNETRRIEQNVTQKLNCMYFVARKVSLPTIDYMLKKEKSDDKDGGPEMYTRFSKELNDLINMYFTISKEENMEVQIAGSEEERNALMPLVYIDSHREKANAESDIKAILRDYHEGDKKIDSNDRMKPLDVVKVLMGIWSERVSVRRYRDNERYWAKYQDYDFGDLFKLASNCVHDFQIDQQTGGQESKRRKLNYDQ